MNIGDHFLFCGRSFSIIWIYPDGRKLARADEAWDWKKEFEWEDKYGLHLTAGIIDGAEENSMTGGYVNSMLYNTIVYPLDS